MQFSKIMIRSELGNKVEELVFLQHLSVAASGISQLLCTQNKLPQV